MSEFINTIDLQGDQETLDALASNTQTSLNDNAVTTLCNHALISRTALTTVNLPEVTSVGDYAFASDTALTSVNLPKATSVGQYAFSGDTSLESISLPEVTTIGNYAFTECERLTNPSLPSVTSLGNYCFKNAFSAGILSVPSLATLGTYLGYEYGAAGFDITNQVTIPASAFNACYNLSTLVLRSNQLCTLSNTNAFTNTPIAKGYGYIYVPSDLVDTYKTNSNWSTYASRIKSLSDYPLEYDGGTITDTWEDIFEAEDDGSYTLKYSVGDTKALSRNGVCTLMQIAAFDTDELSDGSGNAKITWISKGFIYKANMNNSRTGEGGWAASNLRSFLHTVVYPQIENVVKNNIKTVKKTYSYGSGTVQTKTVDDKVWIPSMYELGQGRETSGVKYSTLFPDANSRKKYPNPFASYSTYYQWWLRTVYSSYQFYNIAANGNTNWTYANTKYGVTLCFCT